MLVVEQPVVGPERPVEPHRVVQAGHLHARCLPRHAERQHRGVQQRHVAGVGDDAGVQGGVVGQGAVGPHPHLLAERRVALAAHRIAVHMAQVDRAGAVVPLAHAFLVRGHAGLEVRQRFGFRHATGHRRLVVLPWLVHVEAGLQVEDGPAVLDGDDAAGGEALAVADAVHLVEDRHGGVAWPQEVGVEGVDQPAGLHRAGGRHQRLAGHLPAEDPLAVLVGRDAAEDVDLDRFEVEQGDEVVEGAHGPVILAGGPASVHHAPSG